MNVLKASTILAAAAIAVLIQLPVSAIAQHAFEKNDNVIYEDAKKNETDLGRGFNPVLTADGKIAMIRGPRIEFGQKFDCNDPERKNWITSYDPSTKAENTVFDRAIPFTPGFPSCSFYRLQLSPNSRTLYLLSQVAQTSGTMAVIRLPQGRVVSYEHGVTSLYMIEAGPHRGELIYRKRLYRRDPQDKQMYPYYPWIHARADGGQIRIVSNETDSGNPKNDFAELAAYLRQMGGRITIEGQTLP
jgi:hypothetical protein